MGSFRPLTQNEREILFRLLEESFEGGAAIADQVKDCLAQRIDPSGSLQFKLKHAMPTAAVLSRVPVEGDAVDVDGVAIHILLHVVGGRIAELEIFRDDGETVKRMPSVKEIETHVFPAPP